MSPIKLLIVEDSKVDTEYLKYTFESEPEIETIGTVNNGKEAINFINNNTPDIITMDIEMPVMDGLEATQKIMATKPIPIIIVTAGKNQNQIKLSMEALAAGALSVIEKPKGLNHPDAEKQNQKMVKMVKLMAEVKVIKRKPPENRTSGSTSKEDSIPNIFNENKVIAIGISSGGPRVLNTIFKKISAKFPYPIMVVQHITDGFLDGLINWLSCNCKIPVCIANNNQQLKKGRVYFAPNNYDMGIDFNGRIKLEPNNPTKKTCPSVSYLFKSIANTYGKNSIAMLLTGMGVDGAKELKLLRDIGATTIAQDKQSSLVHGMPGSAIKCDGVNHIFTPENIANYLLKIEQNKVIIQP